MILLSFYSFLAHDRTVPNPLSRYCYQFNEFFIPSMYFYIVRIPETIFLPFHSFLHPIISISILPPMLFLTCLFITNQSVDFLVPIPIFSHVSILPYVFGGCFSTYQLDRNPLFLTVHLPNLRLKFCCPISVC
jgi:hypothetical protein